MKNKTKIIFAFLTWRILLFIPLIFGHLLIPYRQGYLYTSVSYFTSANNPILHFLLSPWANFDGVYYLLIAGSGYTVDGAFFPLFPVSIHALTSIFGNIQAFSPIQYFSGLFLSNVFFFLALVAFYKLIKLDYKANIVFQTILFLLIFPTSFFYASIYSESLFLLLLLLSFYYARKRNYWLASIFGILLTATRFVGIAIFPALLLEFVINENVLNMKMLKQKILKLFPILLTPLGLFSYMFYNSLKWGNPFFFIKAQEQFLTNRTVSKLIFFPQTMYRYIKIFFTVSPIHYEWWIALLEFSTFIFVSVILYVAYRKKVRLSYLIFTFICFMIPIATGTFTGLPRYAITMFPLFIALALIKNNSFKLIYIVVCAALLFLLLMVFSRGYFVA